MSSSHSIYSTYQDSKLLAAVVYFAKKQLKLVFGPFGFGIRLARKEMNILLHKKKLRAYCSIYTLTAAKGAAWCAQTHSGISFLSLTDFWPNFGVYQYIRNVAKILNKCKQKHSRLKYTATMNREQAGEFCDLGRVILYALFFFFCNLEDPVSVAG